MAYLDLSEEEEKRLPLPSGWMRKINLVAGVMMYKDARSGVETEEHPFILQAMNVARKLPLPDGWSIREMQLGDGTKDHFYNNARMGISMWDPPMLRQCLADILGANGLSSESVWVLSAELSSASSSSSSSSSSFEAKQQQDATTTTPSSSPTALNRSQQQSLGEVYQEFKKANASATATVVNSKGGMVGSGYQFMIAGQKSSAPPSSTPFTPSSSSFASSLNFTPATNFLTFGQQHQHQQQQIASEETKQSSSSSSSSTPVLLRSVLPDDTRLTLTGSGEIEEAAAQDERPMVFGLRNPLASSTQTQALSSSSSSVEQEYEWTNRGMTYNNSIDVGGGGGVVGGIGNNGQGQAEPFSPASAFSDLQSQTASSTDQHSFFPVLSGKLSRSEKWEVFRKNTKDNLARRVAAAAQAVVPGAASAAARTTTEGKPHRPPKTLAGLRALREDIQEANLRVHSLMIKIRSALCSNAGFESKVVDPAAGPAEYRKTQLHQGGSTDAQNGSGHMASDLIMLAADIISQLRQHPEHIISAMACCSAGTPGMIQIAFTALHRLLHPFSTDNTFTTAILLQGVNFQVEDFANMEKRFPELDSGKLVSRAIFISDPTTALGWNPLSQPMPVMPNVPSETVLTCLLRMYAIRRDVTSFFRAVWKPILPSVVAVLGSEDTECSTTFANLLSVGSRLLEAIFKDKIMVSFPPVATAVSRSLFEIGGNDALHAYLFNLLILPNLLKILSGDHESADNEQPIRFEGMQAFSDRFFDLDGWWPVEGFSEAVYNPMDSLVWIVWRLYTGAALIEEKKLHHITTKEFFLGGPRLEMSSITDQKLRVLLIRIQRRIDACCQCLLVMPVDALASQFLNVDAVVAMEELGKTTGLEPKILARRFSTLHIKPNNMLSLAVVGRHEVANIFSDVGIAMEATDEAADSSLYRAISEYLVINDEFGDEFGEELLLVPFNFSPTIDGGYAEQKSSDRSTLATIDEEGTYFGTTGDMENVSYKHQLLCRSLTLSERYEAALLRMLRRAEATMPPSIYDLLEYDSWYSSPEFDVGFEVEQAPGFMTKHTNVSAQKMKQNLHGLRPQQTVLVHPTALPKDALLAPAISVDWGQNKSLKSIEHSYHTSLRFNSNASVVNVGTSIARNGKKAAPKLRSHSSLIQEARGHSTSNAWSVNGSRYTKSDLDPNASFAQPTESGRQRNMERKTFSDQGRDRKTFSDQGRDYVKSLRSESGSIDGFSLRGGKKKVARGPPSFLTRGIAGEAAAAAAAARQAPAAAPFPEHLRHRVRQTEANDQYDDDGNGEDEEDEDDEEEGKDGESEIPAVNEDWVPEDGEWQQEDEEEEEEDEEEEEEEEEEDVWGPEASQTQATKNAEEEGVDEDDVASIIRDAANLRDALSLNNATRPNYSPGLATKHAPRAAAATKDKFPKMHHLGTPNTPVPIPGTHFFAPTVSQLNHFPKPRPTSPNKVPAFRPAGVAGVEKNIRVARQIAELRNSSSPPRSVSPSVRAIGRDGRVHIVPLQAADEKRSASPSPPQSARRKSSMTAGSLSPPPPPPSSPSPPSSSSVSPPQSNRRSSARASMRNDASPSPPAASSKRKQASPNLEDEEQETPMRYLGAHSTVGEQQPPPPPPPPPPQQKSATDEDHTTHRSTSPGKPKVIQRSNHVLRDKEALVKMLVDGLEVNKFGKNGSSKPKILIFKESSQELEWHDDPKKKSTVRSMFSMFKTTSKPEIGTIKIADITSVYKGVQTEVLQKSGLVDPNAALSAVTAERSLDITCASHAERDTVYRALKALLDDKVVKFS